MNKHKLTENDREKGKMAQNQRRMRRTAAVAARRAARWGQPAAAAEEHRSLAGVEAHGLAQLVSENSLLGIESKISSGMDEIIMSARSPSSECEAEEYERGNWRSQSDLSENEEINWAMEEAEQQNSQFGTVEVAVGGEEEGEQSNCCCRGTRHYSEPCGFSAPESNPPAGPSHVQLHCELELARAAVAAVVQDGLPLCFAQKRGLRLFVQKCVEISLANPGWKVVEHFPDEKMLRQMMAEADKERQQEAFERSNWNGNNFNGNARQIGRRENQPETQLEYLMNKDHQYARNAAAEEGDKEVKEEKKAVEMREGEEQEEDDRGKGADTAAAGSFMSESREEGEAGRRRSARLGGRKRPLAAEAKRKGKDGKRRQVDPAAGQPATTPPQLSEIRREMARKAAVKRILNKQGRRDRARRAVAARLALRRPRQQQTDSFGHNNSKKQSTLSAALVGAQQQGPSKRTRFAGRRSVGVQTSISSGNNIGSASSFPCASIASAYKCNWRRPIPVQPIVSALLGPFRRILLTRAQLLHLEHFFASFEEFREAVLGALVQVDFGTTRGRGGHHWLLLEVTDVLPECFVQKSQIGRRLFLGQLQTAFELAQVCQRKPMPVQWLAWLADMQRQNAPILSAPSLVLKKAMLLKSLLLMADGPRDEFEWSWSSPAVGQQQQLQQQAPLPLTPVVPTIVYVNNVDQLEKLVIVPEEIQQMSNDVDDGGGQQPMASSSSSNECPNGKSIREQFVELAVGCLLFYRANNSSSAFQQQPKKRDDERQNEDDDVKSVIGIDWIASVLPDPHDDLILLKHSGWLKLSALQNPGPLTEHIFSKWREDLSNWGEHLPNFDEHLGRVLSLRRFRAQLDRPDNSNISRLVNYLTKEICQSGLLVTAEELTFLATTKDRYIFRAVANGLFVQDEQMVVHRISYINWTCHQYGYLFHKQPSASAVRLHFADGTSESIQFIRGFLSLVNVKKTVKNCLVLMIAQGFALPSPECLRQKSVQLRSCLKNFYI